MDDENESDYIYIHEPSMNGSRNTTTNGENDGIPILMVYGSGEDNFLGDDQRGWVTYEQWKADEERERHKIAPKESDWRLSGMEAVTRKQTPVTNELSTKYKTVDTIVSGLSASLTSVASILTWSSSSLNPGGAMTGPGWMQFTRTRGLRAANSTAITLVIKAYAAGIYL